MKEFCQLSDLTVTQAGGMVTVTIDRPRRRNALAPTTLAELRRVFAALRDSPSPKVVVIRGAGEEAFSAGYDLSQPSMIESQIAGDGNALVETLQTIAEHPYPVIAMIHGYCMGAGLDLAATCDIRYASSTGCFAMTPAKIGTLYGAAGTQRIVRLIGPAFAAELFFTGRRLDARRAAEIGLVNRVVEAGVLEAEVAHLAEDIAANAPLSLRGTKRTIALLQEHGLTAEVRAELDALTETVAKSRDFAEGRKAFAEKRRPKFLGR
jgi:enoyl-CoA hydratase